MQEGVPLCVECTDQTCEVECAGCGGELFCRPCWELIHRRGKRARHERRPVLGDVMPAPAEEEEEEEESGGVGGAAMMIVSPSPREGEVGMDQQEKEEGKDDDAHARSVSMQEKKGGELPKSGGGVGDTVLDGLVETCRCIPLRLTESERRLLAVLESALHVSEYTDRVDVLSRWNKARIVKDELDVMLMCMAGLAVAGAVAGGEKMVKSKGGGDAGGLSGLACFFRDAFEAGRRYKISNPNRMRSTYGKMMYMLQDSQSSENVLGFSLVRDLRMVTPFLEERGGVGLLRDPRVVTATSQESSSAAERDTARAELVKEYESETLSEEDVLLALDSIRDANSYLASNAGPVVEMRSLLTKNFDPQKVEGDYSLKISASFAKRALGRFSGGGSGAFSSFGSSFGGLEYAGVRDGGGGGGAKLSHNHSTQYTFVNQSLSLWAEAMALMYRLWAAADGDLLSGRASYRLLNTGQGLNRVQNCPSVSVEMRRVLATVKASCGPWVGLSVVHLGDRDVPNALMFIDKYSQIPDIVAPVCRTVNSIGKMMEDPAFAAFVQRRWGGAREAKMSILCDFFKHAFDGSGDDGGSCIDGRITSAWNWCSRIAKKGYHPLFLEAGFHGFNG